MMIDWVTARIPFKHSGVIGDGHFMSIDREGCVSFSTIKRLMTIGSYDAAIAIRTSDVDAAGDTTEIEISGNPVKFLQGHNLFGSSDLLNLVHATVLKICEMHSFEVPETTLVALSAGNYTISRIDLNEMFHLEGGRPAVLAYLNALARTSRTRNQGAITKGSTVYHNKDSKRWSTKSYSKAQEVELRRNNKQGCITIPPQLREWLQGALRVELTLKSKELIETELNLASNWRTIEESDVYADYIGRISMNGQTLSTDITDKLQTVRPKAAVATYQLWKEGHDVRAFLPHNTFYRHRKALMEFNVDISIPAPAQPVSNVVPLVHALELKPVVIPSWVFGTELFFEPPKVCSL